MSSLGFGMESFESLPVFQDTFHWALKRKLVKVISIH